MDGDALKCHLTRHGAESHIPYAFVAENRVLCTGRSISPLSKRMYGYQNPGPTQRTNLLNHDRLKEALGRRQAIRILAFVAREPMLYRGMPINQAAGLEGNLIARLRPPWKRRRAPNKSIVWYNRGDNRLKALRIASSLVTESVEES